MIKEKVLLAIDNIALENYIMKQLKDEFDFCKPASYRDVVLANIEKYKPNIVVIVEELKGKENITKIVYDIFSKHPNIRVIFVANERQRGDKLINTLINYQVYDLIIGDEINANEIIRKIRERNNYQDIQHLHAIEIVDEEKGQVLFEAPNVEGPKERIVEVIKEVYIETSSKNEQMNPTTNIHIHYNQTSEFDNMQVVGNDFEGNTVLVKDVCPNGFFYYQGYFFNQQNDLDYYYYHEGYFFNENGEAFVNYNGSLISYDEYVNVLNHVEVEEEEFVVNTNPVSLMKEDNSEEEARRQAAEIQAKIKREEEEKIRLENERRYREQMLREEKERALREEQYQQEEKMRLAEEQKRQERLEYEEMLRRKQAGEMEQQTDEYSEKERQNKFMKMFGGKTQNQMMQALNTTSGDKLITFLDSKPGAGATTIAFNLANKLARDNKNVLYIEYNYVSPSVPLLYNLGYAKKGIDSALEGLKQTRLVDVEDAILRMSELKRKKIEGNPFKYFPENLDVLLFSKEFIINYQERMKTFDESFVKELLLYFIFQSNYDYVIFDIQMKPITDESMYQTLFLSQKIFLVTLPDYTYIGYSTFHINEWMKKSILLNNRLHIIVNRYEKSKLTINNICDWLEVDNLIVFEEATRQYIEANLEGIPLVLYNKKSPINNGIASILNYLK